MTVNNELLECIEIREIDDDGAKLFLKSQGAAKENVFVRTQDQWYAAWFGEGELVGVIGISKKRNGTEMGGLFVKWEFRTEGIGTALFEHALSKIKDDKIFCYAVPASRKLPERNGFVVKQTLKNGTVKMERKKNNG